MTWLPFGLDLAMLAVLVGVFFRAGQLVQRVTDFDKRLSKLERRWDGLLKSGVENEKAVSFLRAAGRRADGGRL